jgi:hypothetical protein
MRFWIGHAVLLLLCVVLPFGAGLYVDTHSEVRRAQVAGTVAARLAGQNLESRMTLAAHEAVKSALALAQKVADRDLIGETNKSKDRRDAAVAQLEEMLSAETPQGGFAWLVDETGAIVAENGRKIAVDNPRRIGGHPLFRETQDGYAADGFWLEGTKVALAGAAPINVRGKAQGAVFIGVPIDRAFVDKVSAALNSQLTLVAGDRMFVSTFEPELAQEIVKAAGNAVEAVSAGSLARPIEHEGLAMLPLFIEHDASGIAFSSLSMRVPGLDGLSWIVSAPVGELLRDLPNRQEILLGGLISFFMLALLIGLVSHRIFVAPIGRITDHLSELQFGRGEYELPEARVSAPFRRLVKLINMTVQKIPSRGFSAQRTSSSDSFSEMPASAPSPMSVSQREISALPMRTSDLRLDDAPARMTMPPPPPAYSQEIAEPPDPEPLLKEHPFEGDENALADAVAAMSLRPTAPPAKRVEDEAAAIAAAIASLDSPQPAHAPKPRGASGSRNSPPSSTPPPVAPSLEAPKVPSRVIRSAADIRGVPSDSLTSPSPFPPSASEMFRGNANPSMQPSDELTPVDAIAFPARPQVITPRETAVNAHRPPSTARGGGSLDFGSYSASPLGGGAALSADRIGIGESRVDEGGFNPEATVVAPVTDELLRKSASRDETTSSYRVPNLGGGDMTMVANVPPNLIAQTLAGTDDSVDDQGLDAADHAHFKETYERFIEMRKRCGEATGDLAFDRFLQKLAKNREGLIQKYNCRTVRFQVYEKDGKAALKATPVRAR